jgi:hypothetical protein
MKPNFRFFYVLILNLFYISVMLWLGYSILTGKVPIFWGLLLIAMALRLPEIVTAYSRYSTEDDNFSIDLSLKPALNHHVTPEFIAEILNDPKVIQVIQNDLKKTGQIGYREEWRLGLIPPDQDLLKLPANSRPDFTSHLPLKRTAVLHSTDYFKNDNIAVTNGLRKPLASAKWSYGLSTKLNRGEFIGIRDIQTEEGPKLEGYRSRSLPEFLKEDGFPLKESYADSDPLTTDRSGTIVMDKGNMLVIYPRYFVQRRLIDDEGNLVNLGIDENFSHNLVFEVKIRPAVSRLLLQRVSSKGYLPLVRFWSLPYASDIMLPLVDTPMSASGWADLFIDTRGQAKLFISRDKTLAEWYEMMERLQQLFYSALARADYHLLGLTKDKSDLNEYLTKKQEILQDYYLIQDWKLC